jgi:hypothetical protein
MKLPFVSIITYLQKSLLYNKSWWMLQCENTINEDKKQRAAFKGKYQVRCKWVIVRSLHDVHEKHTELAMSVRMIQLIAGRIGMKFGTDVMPLECTLKLYLAAGWGRAPNSGGVTRGARCCAPWGNPGVADPPLGAKPRANRPWCPPSLLPMATGLSCGANPLDGAESFW